MSWQKIYEKGDRIIYAGVPCTVSRECYIDNDVSEWGLDLTEPMEVVFIKDGLPVFKEVSFSHKHLVKPDLTEESKIFDRALGRA